MQMLASQPGLKVITPQLTICHVSLCLQSRECCAAYTYLCMKSTQLPLGFLAFLAKGFCSRMAEVQFVYMQIAVLYNLT